MKNIHSANEQTLLEAIICTKVKKKAMIVVAHARHNKLRTIKKETRDRIS